MVFVTVQDFHSMCQKHCHYLLIKKDRSSSSLTSADAFIKASRSEIFSLFMRSTLLALLFLSFTWLSLLKYGTDTTATSNSVEQDHPEILLPLLLNDLEKEGLFKLGDKALFLNGGDDNEVTQTVIETEMLLVSANDEETQSMVPNETFDLAFAHSRHIDSADFIDRTLKVGGILAVQLNLQDLPPNFLKHSNYEIVYVKSSEYTLMTMRKTGETEQKQSLVATGRKLLGVKEDETKKEAKKKALSKLEDVLLEPPRAASRKSRTYLKRTRYLPDLMGDNLDLESYSRRVFIDVTNGKGSSGTEWFVGNYPTRNLKFEMYKIETVNDERMSLESEQMGMTEWLKENVKEEEYVVMKAEAEVVEEMMKSKSIKMVDELFLECKPKVLGLRGIKKQSKSGRAYWECLALYGKLRDEGVAVHQWWG